MAAGDERDLLRSIRAITIPSQRTFQEQYLVLSWRDLVVAGTISRFGTWNLDTGESHPGTCYPLSGGPVDFDLDNGVLRLKDTVYKAQVIDIISEQGRRHYSWPGRKDGMFIVCNRISKVVMAMDGSIYDSLMVQMLIDEPERFRSHFALVEEGFPFIRVFRLNRP
jgi:dolichyl-diphosphooligosaccharide--protein glycosyltransferase